MQKIHGEFDKFKKVIEELQKERENLYQKVVFYIFRTLS